MDWILILDLIGVKFYFNQKKMRWSFSKSIIANIYRIKAVPTVFDLLLCVPPHITPNLTQKTWCGRDRRAGSTAVPAGTLQEGQTAALAYPRGSMAQANPVGAGTRAWGGTCSPYTIPDVDVSGGGGPPSPYSVY
jgi:hypothetical protein